MQHHISDSTELTGIDHDQITQLPTRDEFYTNYPFYKYWKSENNGELSTQMGINIYIHIPFCIQICDYCFYMKEVIRSKSAVDDYVEALCREIALVSAKFSLQSRPVQSIYIGGGTPSVLTEAQFKRIVDTLHKHHSIDRPEFTFEAEPGTFNRSKLGWYKSAGVTRISMGVQSFNDEIIRLSSRKHTASQAISAIEMVKDAGDFVINIDLLSGLAGETPGTWEGSLDVALKENTDMVTIYKMKTYTNTNFFKKGVHGNEIVLPSAAEEIGFMNQALDKLELTSYRRWSSFAFTNNNYRHAYIENTWRGKDLIAYGVSSFGKIGHVNYQNSNNLGHYQDKINNKELPVYRSYSLSFKEMAVKEILLCVCRLSSYSRREFTKKFGFDYFRFIPQTLVQLKEKGYIDLSDDDLQLTRRGVLFADFVGQVLASEVKNFFQPDNVGFNY